MPGILPMKMIRVGSTSQSRIAQACDRCRSKKIRCDGVRPVCTQCANVGFECKTSDKLSRRAFPRGYTESLEDRVRGLEAEVRELKDLLDEKDEKLDMLSRIHSFSPPSRKGSSSLSPGTAAQVKSEVQSAREDVLHVEIPAPVQHGSPTTGTSTVSAFMESFEQKIQEHEKRPSNISAGNLLSDHNGTKATPNNASKTPPRILSDQYINLFFQEWQPLLPVVHRPTFLRVYEHYLAGPDAGNWQNNKQAIAQLFLIFEISALSSGHQLKTNCPTYENQWRKALYATSSTPTLSAIQSHVLAQLCYLLRGDYTQLARHRGIAVGMCHQLGLHQAHKYHTLASFEAETSRKVFWCQYALDKFASASTGAPMLLREDDITTDYPADVDDENINLSGFSPTLPGEVTKISSALALFKATRILSKTLEHLYSSKASYQLSVNKLHAYSDELDQWSEELPEHLRLRFNNDKPATNVVSCRSPLLSLMYFYVRGLIHRPLLCHSTGSAQAAATIVLAAAGKHSLQILDLLNERRMNYTFPVNKKELLLTSGLSILWQSIDLEDDSKLVKDNQKSLQLCLNMLARESQSSHTEFKRIACAFVPLHGRRTSLPPKHIDLDTPANSATDAKNKSTRKQLQAIASRFTNFKGSIRPEEARRATVPQTNITHASSMSPAHRAGSTVSLSSTRSAPVMATPSPNSLARSSTINLDYFPLGDDFLPIVNNTNTNITINNNDHRGASSASSSTMLPPRKPASLSPHLTNADASWENLLLNNNTYTTTNVLTPDMFPGVHVPTPMSLTGTDWLVDNSSWNLPAMDFGTKAPVPQSLLSFSGESITSGDEFMFSASSNSGSTTGTGGESVEVGPMVDGGVSGSVFKGITIPVDDEFDFEGLEG